MDLANRTEVDPKSSTAPFAFLRPPMAMPAQAADDSDEEMALDAWVDAMEPDDLRRELATAHRLLADKQAQLDEAEQFHRQNEAAWAATNAQRWERVRELEAEVQRLKDAAADLELARTEAERSVVRQENGAIMPTASNLVSVLCRRALTGYGLRYDEFRAEAQISEAGATWAPIADADITRLKMRLEGVKLRASTEAIREAVDVAAKCCSFDSARDWLLGLRWDGAPRVERFLATYAGAEDSPYTQAVSRYLWSALAGRTLEPGCHAPMVPVLVGAQGAGKSRLVAALAPETRFFTELDLGDSDADQARRLRGLMVAEISELRGLASRDAESIKSFVTRTEEHWTPKFREYAVRYRRRCVFIGTTNEQGFLSDPTGERRWLPVRVERCDPEGVARDREQLWAEAAVRYRAGAGFGQPGRSIEWQDAERLAKEVHLEHKIADAWADPVGQWLAEPAQVGRSVTTAEVAGCALRIEAGRVERRTEQRLGAVLKGLGYRRVRIAVDGKQAWRWVPPAVEDLL